MYIKDESTDCKIKRKVSVLLVNTSLHSVFLNQLQSGCRRVLAGHTEVYDDVLIMSL